MRMSGLQFIIFMSIIFPSCKTTPSKQKETEIPADISASKAKLGMGWNADKENFAGVCVEGTTEEVGSQSSSVRFTSSMSKEELHSMLGFSMSAKAKYGLYKGSAAANFSGENSEDKFSSVTVYSARYEFKNEFFTAEKLSTVGDRINAKPDMWEEGCGHEFVQQTVKGANLLIAARIDFISQEAKSAFNAKFKLKGSAFSAAGELKKASEEFKEKATVSVTAYQKGGDVGLLSTAFGNSNGSGGEALIRCSMSDVDRCIEVLTNLVNYATKKEAGSFPDQIKDNGANNSSADLMYIAYPYITAGVFPPDALMRELLYEQRRSVEEKLNRNIFLRNRKNLFSKLTSIANATEIWNKLDQYERENSTLITTAIKQCFDRIRNTAPEESKAGCQAALTSLTEGFQDIKDTELEIRQADLPACDKGYVRKGMGCERVACALDHKYEDTWSAAISGGNGNFVCDENGADKLNSVACDGNHEASGLSCIGRSCGTHPHNDSWTDTIDNGTLSRACEYGVSKLVSVNCVSEGFRQDGEKCSPIAIVIPTPAPVTTCKDPKGRLMQNGDQSTTTICLGNRSVQQIHLCNNGNLTVGPQQNLGPCTRVRPDQNL